MKVGICVYELYTGDKKNGYKWTRIKNVIGIDGNKMWHIGWDISTKIGHKTCKIISFNEIMEQRLGE